MLPRNYAKAELGSAVKWHLKWIKPVRHIPNCFFGSTLTTVATGLIHAVWTN
jgi:hypothetical protein